MAFRYLTLALLPLFTIPACGGSEPAPAPAGGGGEGGSNGGCVESGQGTLVVEVSGLPAAVDADATLTTPSGTTPLTATRTFDDSPGGTYTLAARRVMDTDPIVRTVYDPTVTARTVCLEGTATETLSVRYTAIPSSNKLWTSDLEGFASDVLGDTTTADPSVEISSPGGKDVAFDRDGNLWSMGATLAEPMVVRLPASELGASGDPEFDRGIQLPISCLPAVRAMAFDPEGNLFVSACGGEIVKVAASSLTRSGDVTAAAVLSGLEDSQDLAFDPDGNLWSTDAGKIVRFDADRLAASTDAAPDRSLTARDAEDSRDLGAAGLAFDADGNLWGFDFGSNTIFQLAASDLVGTGAESVVSEVSITVGVDVLLNRGAFDDGGGLWISYGGTRLARLSPSQLTVSVPSGDAVMPERIVTSEPVLSDLRLGFFPAAAGLPLYHSLP
jgi:sugar lactone lactonase YvrE